MVGKTVDYRLRSINERIGIVQAENDSQSMGPFHDFDIFEEKDFQEVRTEYRSLGRYAVLYSSAKIKSLKLSEWEGICIFLQENGIQPIIV